MSSITVEEVRHEPPHGLTLQFCGQIHFMSLFPLCAVKVFKLRFTRVNKFAAHGRAQRDACMKYPGF